MTVRREPGALLLFSEKLKVLCEAGTHAMKETEGNQPAGQEEEGGSLSHV